MDEIFPTGLLVTMVALVGLASMPGLAVFMAKSSVKEMKTSDQKTVAGK